MPAVRIQVASYPSKRALGESHWRPSLQVDLYGNPFFSAHRLAPLRRGFSSLIQIIEGGGPLWQGPAVSRVVGADPFGRTWVGRFPYAHPAGTAV